MKKIFITLAILLPLTVSAVWYNPTTWFSSEQKLGATTLPVPQGGTGANTLTGCLTGNGTGAITGSGSPCGSASGDITSIGNVSSGAAFDGTQGSSLTFFNAGGNAVLNYDGSQFVFPVGVNISGDSRLVGELNVDSIKLPLDGCLNSVSGNGVTTSGSPCVTFAWPFTVNTGYNSTSTVIGFKGLFSTASSTFGSSLYLPSLTQGFAYLGSAGQVNTTASSSIKLSWFTNDAGFITTASGSGADFPNVQAWGNSTSTALGFLGGFLSTGSSTIASPLRLSSLGQGFLYTGSGGLVQPIASSSVNLSWFNNDSGFLTAVTADAPLSGSGTSGSHLVLSTAGTWSGNAGTASALAANGANCSAGFFPLGVSAAGVAENCTSPFDWTVNTGYNSTSTVIGFNGLFSTASSTFSSDVNLPNLSLNSLLATNGTGVVTGTSTPTFGQFYATSTTATSTITNALQFGGTARDNLTYFNASGRIWPASVSTGGAVNIDEGTQAQSPALVVHGNSSGAGTGRLMVLNQDGTAVTQDMFVASSSCSNCTAINIKGAPTGKGILKIEHTGNPTDANANSSLFSGDMANCGNCQGIFLDATIASTTGKLLNLRNKGQEVLSLDFAGRLGISTTSPYAQLSVRSANAATTTVAFNSYPGQTADIFHIQDGATLALVTQAGGFSTTTLSGLNIKGSATSTSNVGYNITTGCYAVSGSCITGGTGGGSGTVTSVGLSLPSFFAVTNSPVTITGTLTGSIAQPANSILTTDSAGTNITATGSQLTVGNLLATSTTATSTFVNAVRLGNTAVAKDNMLQVDCSGRVFPGSVSTGGCVNIDNGSVNGGTALEVKSAFGAGATGRGIVFNETNSAFDQDWILASSSAGNTSVLNVKGAPTGKGVVKIEHTGNNTDANSASSILSLDGLGCGQCQGIFMDFSVAPGTTGKMLNLRNHGVEYLTQTWQGTLGLGTTTPAWFLQIATSTTPQLALTDSNSGANLKHWTERSAGGNLYFATSSDLYATSTIAALTLTNNGYLGVASTSPSQALGVTGNALISGTTYASNFVDTALTGSGCVGESSGLLGANSNCVSSIASAGSSLTVSSPTGNVDLSLNAAHTNTWSVLQNFNYSSSTIYSSFLTASTTFLNAGSITVATSSAGCAAFMNTGLLTSIGAPCGSGGAGITSLTAGAGLLGGTITTSGTIYGSVGTSSTPTISPANLAYWTTQGDTTNPAKLGSVATGTIGVSGGITATANQYIIGSGLTIGCTTATASVPGCIAAADFSKFNSATTTFSTGLTYTGATNAVTVNNSQSIATLSNLTTNGYVKTSGSNGTLGVQLVPIPIADGGTNNKTISSNSLMFYDGTSLVGTTSQLTVGSILATSTTLNSIFLGSGLFVGTSTDGIALVTFATSTVPQLSLGDATAGDALWSIRNAGANLYFATTTVTFGPNATSTTAALSLLGSGSPGLSIGSTTPFADFSLQTIAGNQILAIGSSTGTYMAMDKYGHVSFGAASQPVLSSCGGAIASLGVPKLMEGNDMNGIIWVGGGATTACTLTFLNWPVAFTGATPVCLVQNATNTAITLAASTTSTTLVIASSATMGGYRINYQCFGNLK